MGYKNTIYFILFNFMIINFSFGMKEKPLRRIVPSLEFLSSKAIAKKYEELNYLDQLQIPSGLKTRLINYGSKGYMLLKGQKGPILNIKSNKAGNVLASSSYDGTVWIRIRDENGKYFVKHALFVVADHIKGSYILPIGIGNDFNIIVTGAWDGFIKIWKLQANGKYLCTQTLYDHISQTLYDPTSRIFALTMSNNGKVIVSSSQEKTIIWMRNSSNEYIYKASLRISIYSVIVSEDAEIIISGLRNKIRIDKLNNDSQYELFQILEEHTEVVYALALSKDYKIIVSASFDKTIKIWKLNSNNEYVCTQTLKTKDKVSALAMSEDCQIIVNGLQSGAIEIWQLNNNQEYECINDINGHSETVTSLNLISDSKTLISGSEDGTIRIWDMEYFI